MDRRRFVTSLSGGALGAGAGSSFAGGILFPGVLWAHAQAAGEITAAVVARASELVGLSFTDAQIDALLSRLESHRTSYAQIRATSLPPDLPPSLTFDPGALLSTAPSSAPSAGDPPGDPSPEPSGVRSNGLPGRAPSASAERPASDVDLAFLPVTDLADLLRSGQVSSMELTELFLDRLRRHDPELECVVTLTGELAREQAARADEELARGVDRGPLHGIPWGAKDLLAVRGYPTTWGAAPYRNQVLDYDATAVRRLEEAGAVLVAKLTLGALAMGDVWFGGRTRNPWNLEEGSSGSSAGSAAATAAGLVPFALGSETLGSIVSPSTRCGVTGLRPTFGRVSRHGAMPLSWRMDKLGPLARNAEDCALVLGAIHGADGQDPAARSVGFTWDPERPARQLRVGFYRAGFESDDVTALDRRVLEVLRQMGLDLVPVDLPDGLPTEALRVILFAEAGAAFDQLTRSERIDELGRQDEGAWPNVFRAARFIPAVEYIQANRIRTRILRELETSLEGVDALVTPSYADPVLLMTNLAGHPAVLVPNGFEDDGTPVGITFVGRLWGEADILALARAYQDETGFHRSRPPRFG
ncbi:MAG: amidase [Gemmatimonadota bacterium]